VPIELRFGPQFNLNEGFASNPTAVPPESGSVTPTHVLAASVLLALALVLSACQPSDESEEPPAPIRPVRVVTVDELPGGETVTLTGNFQARDDVSLGFRVGGQLIERTVNVGDQVRAGQVVARLDAQTERNAVDAARAELAEAMARLVEARNTVQRYEPMLERGFVARAQLDRAMEARDAAQARVDAVTARVATAENQLEFTTLVADGPGVVTARGAEPGEVVAAGEQMRQRTAEAIELPNDKHVAGADEIQRPGQPGAITLGAGGVVLEQVPVIDASREQRITLQVCALTVGVR